MGAGEGEKLPVVVVHGGAWNIPDSLRDGSEAGVRKAAEAAREVLVKDPEDALGAVEAAVRTLEDDPIFDAGTGSCLTEDRDVEMDSIVMCGQTLRSGAVAGVKNIKNPVSLARKVLEKTSHCLLVGEGADKFARQQGIRKVPLEELVSKEAIQDFEKHSNFDHVIENNFQGHDTVGCVVLTGSGNMASATSTGGISRKMAGRVGDSPLVGSGAYCDNSIGTASSTGHGESIMTVVLARRALFHVEGGMGASEAAAKALAEMKQKTGGEGGLIMISPNGDVAHEFTTPRMPWCVVRGSSELISGIDLP